MQHVSRRWLPLVVLCSEEFRGLASILHCPITPVRQSAQRTRVPVILDPAELHRLFGELGIRERAMIIVDALTGIRRSELMGLQWGDVDFIGSRIEITRSNVDQIVGKGTWFANERQATRETPSAAQARQVLAVPDVPPKPLPQRRAKHH